MSKHNGLFDDITSVIDDYYSNSTHDLPQRWQAFLDDLPDDLPMQVKLMALGDLNSGANIIRFAEIVQEARE